MKTLAITGGIACGKSLVGGLLRDRGFPVCETDELGHALLAPGTPVYDSVVAEFGEDIVSSEGGIDRGRLGRMVFADDARRVRLNQLVHPHVHRLWNDWMADRRAEGSPWGAVIIPLMYEVGWSEAWSAVLCVAAPGSAQLERMRKRGWSDEDAARRVRAQWPLETKMERADYVIYNGGTVELVKEQLDRILVRLLGEY